MWWENQKLPLNEKIRSWGYLRWSYPELGTWQKDEGSRMKVKVLHSNAVPSREFQWHCQFAAQEGTFKLAILLCWYLFVDQWTCVLCRGNLASCVWGKHLRVMGEMKGKQTQAQCCHERDRSSPQWQGRTTKSSGMEGIREIGRDWVSERGFWDDLSYFKLWKIVQEKCIFSMVNSF